MRALLRATLLRSIMILLASATSAGGDIALGQSLVSGREVIKHVTFKGHTAAVTSVAFSRDGKVLASGSKDKTIKLWDVAAGKEMVTLKGHTGPVTSVAFGPDGTTLGSGSEDRTVRLWDLGTGKERFKCLEYQNRVLSVAFSPDGKMLASAGRTASHSADGKLLRSGSRSASIILWNVATGKELRRFPREEEDLDDVYGVAFSPDGKTLATATRSQKVLLWDPATGKERLDLGGDGLGRAGCAVAFSPDGKSLATGHCNWAVWDVAAGKTVAVLNEAGPSGERHSLVFLAEGKTLAIAGDRNGYGPGKHILLWDVTTGLVSTALEGHTGTVLSLAYSPVGRILASASADNTIKLWHFPAGKKAAK